MQFLILSFLWFVSRSRAGSARAPVYHILWVRGFRPIPFPGSGFNLFKPLRRHFRATSILPSATKRLGYPLFRGFGRPLFFQVQGQHRMREDAPPFSASLSSSSMASNEVAEFATLGLEARIRHVDLSLLKRIPIIESPSSSNRRLAQATSSAVASIPAVAHLRANRHWHGRLRQHRRNHARLGHHGQRETAGETHADRSHALAAALGVSLARESAQPVDDRTGFSRRPHIEFAPDADGVEHRRPARSPWSRAGRLLRTELGRRRSCPPPSPDPRNESPRDADPGISWMTITAGPEPRR